MAVEKAEGSDATTIALLKWIFAGLLLLNGGALILATEGRAVHDGLLGGFRWNYAAGVACALVGGLCWMLSHGSIPQHDGGGERNGALQDRPGARDHAILFGTLAIMLWVASLATFVTGCERLSWSPRVDRTQRLLHSTPVADRHRSFAG
ncbi:MAG TPA: hypothetical protein VH331_06150 [Allosphingosinicella sp.]|nr:hypothetical protein [Allosphingosinicella sp.]